MSPHTLSTAANPRQEALLGEQALGLTVRCLNFDFIGTNPDESTEDVGTIQAPSSWRVVLQDPDTLEMLFHFYRTTEPPRSSKAMEATILLCSVRRSLFPTDKDREAFLGRLMVGIRELLKNQTGLQHQDNYHEFCRLLGRLKSNYQLSELVKTDGYLEWLELASNFTVQSIRNWQYSTNSIHYLLALWGRLVAAVPYVRPDTGARGHVEALEKEVVTVVSTYIESMLASVETVLLSDGALDDPLEDEGSLKEQMDRLPTICRFQYETVANLLIAKFDPLLAQYRDVMQHLGSTHPRSYPPDVAQKTAVLEGQLTWLTYMVGTIIGGHSWSSSQMGDGEETIDASLSRRVLQLAQGVDYRLSSSQGMGKAMPKLEIALLYYFQYFRRVYMFMWDQITGSSGASSMNSTMSIGGTVVSVVGMGGGSMSTSRLSHDSAPSVKQKVYQRMFEHLGMGDHSAVSNLIVTKIGNNLKYWAEEQDIVGKTLELLLDMASGYSSSKLLLTLDTVKFLTCNHTEDHFPFLALPANVRHRTTFHATLTRLLLSPNGEDKLGLKFDQFMEPICRVMTQLESLATPQDLRSEAARRPIIGVYRDLRGITASMHNRKTFSRLFETLYPQHLPFMARVADTWWDQPDVIVSLLKFCLEFCHNKANRINFDQSSANGILLFRTVSDVVCAFGRRLLASGAGTGGGPTTPISGNGSTITNGGDQDIYKQRYKGISLALNVLNSALGGNYVCFGVFALYKDPCLDNALEIALQMTLSIPLEHVLQYPKVSKAYFSFIEILMRNHISTALALDTTIFMQLMSAVHEGLQTSDATLSSACANSVDHLATFYFNSHEKAAADAANGAASPGMNGTSAIVNKQAKKDLAEMNLNKHLAAQPNLFSSLTSTIFNLLLFGPPSNHWAVLRPILSLVLADESSFTAYKDYLIQTQSAENQKQLSDAFSKLLAETSRNLESANRERFTQKLTAFRVAARSFLTL